jgi:hypothetical protein
MGTVFIHSTRTRLSASSSLPASWKSSLALTGIDDNSTGFPLASFTSNRSDRFAGSTTRPTPTYPAFGTHANTR